MSLGSPVPVNLRWPGLVKREVSSLHPLPTHRYDSTFGQACQGVYAYHLKIISGSYLLKLANYYIAIVAPLTGIVNCAKVELRRTR